MSFIHENFLLENTYAEELYHSYAKPMPIIDYHNHLVPEELAGDYQFKNISEAWLAGDHYKWRAMRAYGIQEDYITGKASDHDKFLKWAEVVPHTMRNPLYHWSHLELKRYFGIDTLLTPKSAQSIYVETTEQLQQQSHSALGLLKQQNVSVVCTTDDPVDDLHYHQKAKEQGIVPAVYPTFRPDEAYAVEKGVAYINYIERLGARAGVDIKTYADLLSALDQRIAFFDTMGCRAADHGMARMYYSDREDLDEAALFKKVLDGKSLDEDEITFFKFKTLLHLCKQYHHHAWVMQFHLGVFRNNNSRMKQALGPNTGFDSIGDDKQGRPLLQFLDLLDRSDQLCKTVLYNLNPADNELFATAAGNFNTGGIRAKMQYGSGWWYLDQLDGMEKQMNTLSNMGLLSCFVGMLTDSRSLLSFTRHEYFRRLLCNILGKDIAKGHLPKEMGHIGKMVQDICYNNAKDYFNLNINE